MKDIAPLTIIFDDQARLEILISRLIARVEHHLKQMGALKGIAARKTYDAIKAVRPNYVEHILNVLSHAYLKEYLPMHERYRADQHLPANVIQPLREYIRVHANEAEMHFWCVADDYAKRSNSHFLGKLYFKFRPMIKEHLPIIADEISGIIEDLTISEVKDDKSA